jgi:hypothetical protein
MGFETSTYLAIGAIGSALGTGISVMSQIQQGSQQKRWAEYNAAVAERDAEVAKQNAEYEAGLKRKETERLLGRQRALYGKAGVVLEGSPLLLMAETAAEGELDALMIERGGRLQSERYRTEATISNLKGKAAQRAGYYGAGTTLLTGASKTAYRYGEYKAAGIGG